MLVQLLPPGPREGLFGGDLESGLGIFVLSCISGIKREVSVGGAGNIHFGDCHWVGGMYMRGSRMVGRVGRRADTESRKGVGFGVD